MPHRQLSSKSSQGKGILLKLAILLTVVAVAVAGLLFYGDDVRVLIVPTIKSEHLKLRADATQQDNALISGSAVTQKNYTTATGDRTNVTNTGIVGNSLQKDAITQKNYTKATGDRNNVTNIGMVGNSLQKANNINSKNASGLVLPNILIIGAQKGKYLTTLVIHDLFHKNARI